MDKQAPKRPPQKERAIPPLDESRGHPGAVLVMVWVHDAGRGFSRACRKYGLFAFAKERVSKVHYQLFGDAGAPAQPDPAHRQARIDDNIAYRLEARKGHAALGRQVVTVSANPGAVKTLKM